MYSNILYLIRHRPPHHIDHIKLVLQEFRLTIYRNWDYWRVHFKWLMLMDPFGFNIKTFIFLSPKFFFERFVFPKNRKVRWKHARILLGAPPRKRVTISFFRTNIEFVLFETNFLKRCNPRSDCVRDRFSSFQRNRLYFIF